MKTKTCKDCRRDLPTTEFYAHPHMADGLLNKCKDCVKARVAKHRLENLDRIREYDRERGKHSDRIKASSEHSRRWHAEDKRRTKAHNAVARAIKAGRLVRKPCERCGSDRAYAHHENYDKPLDVTWLCQPDHKQRHKEMVLAGIEP